MIRRKNLKSKIHLITSYLSSTHEWLFDHCKNKFTGHFAFKDFCFERKSGIEIKVNILSKKCFEK